MRCARSPGRTGPLPGWWLPRSPPVLVLGTGSGRGPAGLHPGARSAPGGGGGCVWLGGREAKRATPEGAGAGAASAGRALPLSPGLPGPALPPPRLRAQLFPARPPRPRPARQSPGRTRRAERRPGKTKRRLVQPWGAGPGRVWGTGPGGGHGAARTHRRPDPDGAFAGQTRPLWVSHRPESQVRLSSWPCDLQHAT